MLLLAGSLTKSLSTLSFECQNVARVEQNSFCLTSESSSNILKKTFLTWELLLVDTSTCLFLRRPDGRSCILHICIFISLSYTHTYKRTHSRIHAHTHAHLLTLYSQKAHSRDQLSNLFPACKPFSCILFSTLNLASISIFTCSWNVAWFRGLNSFQQSFYQHVDGVA